MTKLTHCSVIALAATTIAMGAGFSVPAVTVAEPGSTVSIPVTGTGHAGIAGFNLSLEAQAPLEIVAVDLVGSVFASNNTGLATAIFPDAPNPQWAIACTTTYTGLVSLPGLLATVRVHIPVITDFGDYAFRTEIPELEWVSDFAGSPGVTVDAQGYGIISVTPEPSSLLLLALAGGLVATRRERSGTKNAER